MKNIVVALAAVVLASAPAVALDGPGRALVASDTLQLRGGPAQTSDPHSTVFNGFIPPYSGTVRVKWEVRSSDGTQVGVVVSVAHTSECDHVTSSTSFVAQSCDIRVVGGFPLAIEASSTGAATVTLRLVSLNYTVGDFDGKSIRYIFLPN
jgi:hypothetical protein